MKVALAQLNTTVGDLAGNEAKILAAYRRGVDAGARIVVCPELAITGYPPRDLLLRTQLRRRRTSKSSTGSPPRRATPPCSSVTSAATNAGPDATSPTPSRCCSAGGSSPPASRPCCRPTMSSTRTVTSSRRPGICRSNSTARKIGLTICEDIWNDEDFWPRPALPAQPAGRRWRRPARTIIFNVSASPWHLGQEPDALRHAAQPRPQDPAAGGVLQPGRRQRRTGLRRRQPGVQRRRRAASPRAKLFEEDFVDRRHRPRPTRRRPATGPDEELVFKALVLGLRDYLHKCGFQVRRARPERRHRFRRHRRASPPTRSARKTSAASPCRRSSRSQGSLDDARALAQEPRHPLRRHPDPARVRDPSKHS